MANRRQCLIWLLRALGTVDLCALIAVFSSRAWIANSHQWLGLGTFPIEPIAGYLARCTSVWYGSYGILLWFVSCDIEKYARLITCIAATMFVQGFVIVGIDIAEGMPNWWIALEGPCCSGLGASLLFAQWYSRKAWLPSCRNKD